MTEQSRIILVALDDNREIWYDQVIPFLLSLKETDYNGEIGFISYGISEYKVKLLEEFGCKVFPASRTYSEMLLDRQISVADIAEKYNYQEVALYDADIWFPTKHLSIFDEIMDLNKLYAAPDAWRCTFLSTCLDQYSVEELNFKLDEIVKKFGYVFQAGVIVGHQQGWIEYRQYVEEMLAIPNQFKQEYGLDATLFNLYFYDKDGIVMLDKKYNCSPPWGIQIAYPKGVLSYCVDGKNIEGLHVTRAVREAGTYSYHKIFHNKYYSKGMHLRGEKVNLYSITKSSIIDAFSEKYIGKDNVVEVKLESACVYEHLSTGFTTDRLFSPKDSFILTVSGDSVIELSNPSENDIKFSFHFTNTLHHSPSREVYLDGENGKNKLNINSIYGIDLKPKEKIKLTSEEIDINRRIHWLFHDVKFVE